MATTDTVCVKIGDSRLLDYVPKAHIGQILHQMLVLSMNVLVYVSAAETGLLFVVVVYCPQDVLTASMNALNSAESIVAWAHEEDPTPPVFATPDSVKRIEEKLPFWLLVNNHVKETDAFVPLKLFKHAAQSFYSKTKGGVDGSAQYCAIMRSSTSKRKWEQKIVSQTLKTVCINSFFGWRIMTK